MTESIKAMILTWLGYAEDDVQTAQANRAKAVEQLAKAETLLAQRQETLAEIQTFMTDLGLEKPVPA